MKWKSRPNLFLFGSGSSRWRPIAAGAACRVWVGRCKKEGRFAEAGEHYRTAAQLQPDSAIAQLNLGGLHEELGEMAEAEAAFRTALRLQPAFALPHARIATLLRGKLSDADLAALEQRLADEQLGQGPARAAIVLFGPRARRPRRLRPRRRMPAPGQRPDPGARQGAPRLFAGRPCAIRRHADADVRS